MNNISNILLELKNEPSTNNKQKILSKYKDDETLKKVIYKALSKRVKYGIKQIPDYKIPTIPTKVLDDIFPFLELLESKTYTGNKAISELYNLLSSLSEDDSDILAKIIRKDLKINIGTSIINKVIPNLLETTPYMGAKAYDQKLAMKFFGNGVVKSDVKMDGRYANAIIIDGEVELVSRQGEKTYIDGSFLSKQLSTLPNCVLNGELTIDGFNRYQSNGMITSIIDINQKISNNIDVTSKLIEFSTDNTITYEEALNKIVYTCWDILSINDYFNKKNNLPYYIRWDKLQTYIVNLYSVRLVEHRFIDSYLSAMEHFLEIIERGDEGTIIKDMNSFWKDGKGNNQMKWKLEMSVDLRIKGFNYGSIGTKNEHIISVLVCESECGMVKTSPGGMTEKMMNDITSRQDELLDTIVEVRSCGLSQNRFGEYSLLHPSVNCLRDDKDSCDNLEQIKAIEQMAKQLNENI